MKTSNRPTPPLGKDGSTLTKGDLGCRAGLSYPGPVFCPKVPVPPGKLRIQHCLGWWLACDNGKTTHGINAHW